MAIMAVSPRWMGDCVYGPTRYDSANRSVSFRPFVASTVLPTRERRSAHRTIDVGGTSGGTLCANDAVRSTTVASTNGTPATDVSSRSPGRAVPVWTGTDGNRWGYNVHAC